MFEERRRFLQNSDSIESITVSELIAWLSTHTALFIYIMTCHRRHRPSRHFPSSWLSQNKGQTKPVNLSLDHHQPLPLHIYFSDCKFFLPLNAQIVFPELTMFLCLSLSNRLLRPLSISALDPVRSPLFLAFSCQFYSLRWPSSALTRLVFVNYANCSCASPPALVRSHG